MQDTDIGMKAGIHQLHFAPPYVLNLAIFSASELIWVININTPTPIDMGT